MNTRPEPIYSTAQRFTALGYGLASHTLFLASVAAMFWSLYNGLHLSLLHLHGGAAALMNLRPRSESSSV